MGAPGTGPATWRLYSYWRSSASYRVRIGLHFKGIPFEYVPVHLVRSEQTGEPYRAINPMGQVPTLERVTAAGALEARLTQSVAILEYLEEVHPAPPLLPRGPADRARVRQVVEGVNAGIQPLQNLAVMRELTERFGYSAQDNAGWAVHWIARGFDALERIVGASAGAFAVGDAVSLADVFLVPQVYNARRFGIDMESRYPTLARVDAAARAVPAFQLADPSCQPDAQA